MNKYIVYRCTVCERQTEIEENGSRPDPIRCNITNRCRGKLERIGSRSNKQFLFTPVVSGLEDFIPRGTEISKTVITQPAPQVSLLSGPGMISMSVMLKRTESGNTIYSVLDEAGALFDVYQAVGSTNVVADPVRIYMKLFELTPEILSYKKYTFVRNEPVSLLQGSDDSPEAKNLRFTQADNLQVYVNGILAEASEFDSSIDNQITFTPMITDTNNVIEVLVYTDIDASIDEDQLIDLEFKPLHTSNASELTQRNSCAWGSHANALIIYSPEDQALMNDDNTANDPLDTSRHILYCVDLGPLSSDKSYGVARVEVTSLISGQTRSIKPGEVNILLAREPYAFSDRELFAYVSGTDLITEDAVLSYARSQATGDLLLTIEESRVTQTFNPIQPRVKLTAVTDSNLLSTDQQSQKLNRRYIKGPV